MRKRVFDNGLSVHAICGSHSIILGMNIVDDRCKENLLGFAIKRVNYIEDDTSWVKSRINFALEDQRHSSGRLSSTRDAPIQKFCWGDYNLRPDTQYSYFVYPVYGEPTFMTYGRPVEVTARTEAQQHEKHAIFFNRGMAGSQSYAEHFFNLPIDTIGEPAYKWLSGGLEEGILYFINEAKDSSYGIRCAFYEFNYPPVLSALKAAIDRGVDVEIIYDNKDTDSGPGEENRRAIAEQGLEKYCRPRESNTSYISHNKFMILMHHNAPIEVWTGSTNITKGGILGHSNVGHQVRDRSVASSYYEYWCQLYEDPNAKELRLWNSEVSQLPKDESDTLVSIFSPQADMSALERYADEMESAKQAVFLTAAFGLNPEFQAILEEEKDYLRYVLLDKPGKGLSLINQNHNNEIVVGNLLKSNQVESWLNDNWHTERLTGLNTHVQYVHTKFMLVDPLTEHPLVITGSANFSMNSTKNNDENMLFIRGDTRVADIYLCEFMRIFNHYRMRSGDHLSEIDKNTGEPTALHLKPDNSWLDPYFDEENDCYKERLLFA